MSYLSSARAATGGLANTAYIWSAAVWTPASSDIAVRRGTVARPARGPSKRPAGVTGTSFYAFIPGYCRATAARAAERRVT